MYINSSKTPGLLRLELDGSAHLTKALSSLIQTCEEDLCIPEGTREIHLAMESRHKFPGHQGIYLGTLKKLLVEKRTGFPFSCSQEVISVTFTEFFKFSDTQDSNYNLQMAHTSEEETTNLRSCPILP